MTRKNLFYQTVLGVGLGGFLLYFAVIKLYVNGQDDNTDLLLNTNTSEQKSDYFDAVVEQKKPLYLARFVKAAAENAKLRNSIQWVFGGKRQVGWSIYIPLIGQTILTESPADSPEFAFAVSGWQEESGLAPTGIIDLQTFEAFIKIWQSQRLHRSNYPTPEELLSVPVSEFYDPSREPELLKVERRTYSAYKRMLQAAAKDASLGLNVTKDDELAMDEKFMRIISAFRSREYQQQLRRRQPNAGRGQLAKNSPHFTGHALDIYVGGDPVSTNDANRAVQVQTPAYRWLVKNARSFGFYPYFYEPWHWEFVPVK